MSHAFIVGSPSFKMHCSAALVSPLHLFLYVNSLLIRSPMFRLGDCILVGSTNAPSEPLGVKAFLGKTMGIFFFLAKAAQLLLLPCSGLLVKILFEERIM